jgi:hydroxypyruvate isomerase
MARIKQCLSWWCFSKVDRKPFLAEAKKIGYAGIELATTDIWDDIRAAGLTIVTHGVGSLADGINRKETHAAFEEEVNKSLELAVKYKIPNLIIFSGNRRGLDDEKGAAVVAEGLKRVAKAAENKGVTLVLELLNSKVDHIDYQCDHTDWGVKVIKMVGSPRVKLLYDIYHMQIMEGDVIRTIQNNIDHIGHIHTAGNPGRRDMDDTQELNYRGIMNAIAATNYSGFVGHEFIPKGDPVEAIRQAYALCNV